MFFQRGPHHSDKNGHIEQVGNCVWPGGNGTGFGADRNSPTQSFRSRNVIGAAAELGGADDHPGGKLIRKPQEFRLHVHWIHCGFILFSWGYRSDGVAGNVGCGREQTATGAESEEEQAKRNQRTVIRYH